MKWLLFCHPCLRLWGEDMSGSDLTQVEADVLLRMPKVCETANDYVFPRPGKILQVNLVAKDGVENFILDINRKKICHLKLTKQTRARGCCVLARLCIGTPHRNPDGEEIPSPHLHVYREGCGDKWAIAAPPEWFSGENLMLPLDAFMKFCCIVSPPSFRGDLFQ